MLVFILLPVVGEFDFGFEETIFLDLFHPGVVIGQLEGERNSTYSPLGQCLYRW